MGNKTFRLFVRIFLGIGALVSIFPFYWMLVMASKQNKEIYQIPPDLLLGSELFHNIETVFRETAFFHSLFNTLFIAIISTVLILFFDSLAGFAFAKLRFKGKGFLFTFLLGTMMIPGQLNIIPSFYLMDKLGWVGSYKALIIPGMANAFGIFWLKQYCTDAIPDSLIESAKLDGCSAFKVYVAIALPIMKPALAFLALYSFMGSWNDYMWPLIILNDESKYTLMLALTQLKGLYTVNYPLVITGTLLATIPLLLVFAVFSRQLITGITEGAVKQ
ncbi:carbohydrate ABC transporter permease [Streptococcus acidominimus]|uniref:ABC transporter, predicted N-acetylneuraminate transport system permease protein 2 n=1 Tax=Streptococcus acidominimus TaxID=1326 RepID=A0A1Q8EFM4_STRAI|nr:carbohydrate ABC transporter permease [Streptococcus acidominimus]MBF0847319.1 carbohydrate ABC transporter permease [Streptococcus danieliae]MBF0818692.1 carbohydrate ABC transporter permease [Streptococcus acidominimus]MBF0838365.1 carbohydrate ABC transporter permease [Streptococcus acidominimus]OLF50605.1 sugar ABC transporter permease [Streptococcus acidominimus]TFU30860.1 carbohydrate ABC transporter permease [Streptococcus acidominimus]